MPCVRDILQTCGLDRIDAQVLLQHALGVSRSWLIAHDTDPLSHTDVDRVQSLIQRRQAGEPVAYVVGEREFMGHVFRVTPAVLIPRPDTECLVDAAIAEIERCRTLRPAPRVLDLGTGSGAIAVSLALACPDARVLATDLCADALVVAIGNAQRLGAGVEFHAGSWYHALPSEAKFDLIVSNPPYIDVDDPHLQLGDLRHEPLQALTDGQNGLTALSDIISQAPKWLETGGALWVEHGWQQASAVRALLEQFGFTHVQSRKDLAGIERISGGYL